MENPVIRLLQDRWPGRGMLPDPLSDEIVHELIESVRLTPSCFNNQPWRFIFLTGEQARAAGLAALTERNQTWASRAALLVFGYARKEDDCAPKDGRQYYQFDLGMAVMNLLLSATHHGLAARPMAGFDPKAVRELYDLDKDDDVLIAIAIGRLTEQDGHVPEYARSNHLKPRVRKEASEIVRWIK